MNTPQKHKREWGLDIVAYFTLLSIAIASLLTLPDGIRVWPIVLNFVLIAGIMASSMEDGKSLRQRVIYLGTFTLLTSGFYLLGVDIGIYQILFFVISSQAMMLLPAGYGVLWLLLLVIISGGTFMIEEGFESGLLIALVYGGGYLFFGIFGRSLLKAQDAGRRSDALLAELQQAHQQLQEHVLQVEQLAVSEERNRLAREMHDALGHRLTVSAVQLEGAQRLIPIDPIRAETMVGTVRGQVREALAELRQTVATLRKPIDIGLDFKQALTNLIVDFESATDLTVNLMIPEDFPSLPNDFRLTLYRTAQEALTNVQRHANAKQVWVQLDNKSGWIELSVGDDGDGLKDAAQLEHGIEKQGFGLQGMRERAAQLAGECFIEARPGGGVQITTRLPWEADQDDH